MNKRDLYLQRISPFIGKPIIKVLTGMRRVGKSYLLRQLGEQVENSGISPARILYIDKESLDFEHIRTYRDLHQLTIDTMAGQPGCLLVDEVQEIEGWERALASLSKREDIDIYITGSNAQLFSSELATLLSGRYIEFPIYALSFAEFRQFRGEESGEPRGDFADYLRYGSLPAIHHFPFAEEVVYQYLSSIYDTILLKDVVKRHNIRNVALLENIARYVFDNIGNVFSAKKVADYLKSQRLRVGVETVQNYLSYFQAALLIHKVPRYDVKGKRLLDIHEKYYLGDIGMRHALLGFREADIGGLLENLVFLELKRRGYDVCIGKLGQREIDFVATRTEEKLYVQVAYLLASPETIEREFGALLGIADNYPKVVLSMDEVFGADYEGIQRINIVDFLLGEAG